MGDRRCCCETEVCLIQSNDLDSDADLDDNFTLSDGDEFSYHGDPFDAIQVSNASQTATANTPHPQSPYPPRVQIEFYGDQIGSQVRIILGGAIVVQVTVGDGTSDLDILDASDDSELCETIACSGIDRNEWHRLIVCYDPDTGVIKADLTDIADPLSTTYSGCAVYDVETPIGRYAAFGTGPDHVDNVYVRNFRFWRLWYCGDTPYTEDCHIARDSWDYYYELPPRKKCFDCLTEQCQYCKNDKATPAHAVVELGSFGSVSFCAAISSLYYLTGCWPCGFFESYAYTIGINTYSVELHVEVRPGFYSVVTEDSCGAFSPVYGTDPYQIYLLVRLRFSDNMSFSNNYAWGLPLETVPLNAYPLSSADIGSRAGTLNGKPYYEFVAEPGTLWTGMRFYLFYDGSQWVISSELGALEQPFWTSATIAGEYTNSTYGTVLVLPGVFCDELENRYVLPYLGACHVVTLGVGPGELYCTYDGSPAIVEF